LKPQKLFELIKILISISLFCLATIIYPANPEKFVSLSEKKIIKAIIVSKEININTASESELVLLNGIGEKKAKAIIAYRLEHGPFKTTKDLRNVKGISKSVYARIKDLVVV